MFPLRSRTIRTVLGACTIAVVGAGCAGEAEPPATAGQAGAPPAASATAATLAAATPEAAEGVPQVTVYKSPTCGCCAEWVDHLRDNGFTVIVHDQEDLSAVKTANGITPRLESCHTGVVDGYVVEGHVPADLIARLLTERPDIAGLAVPGMPGGSPGMESAPKEAYQVLAIGKDGRTSVYANR
ncbi:MAG: DUF411 domain-containing protein [Gemmatimonadaceae bacterium]